MLLCDTNIWLALALSGHVHHRASRAWLDTINAPGVIHFCRATQQSLLRLLTNRTVLGAYGSPPLTSGFELVTTDTAFTQYGGIELRLLAK